MALTAGAALFGFPFELAESLIVIVRVTEAMLRKVQRRLVQRLLKVETLIADGASENMTCPGLSDPLDLDRTASGARRVSLVALRAKADVEHDLQVAS